MLTRRGRALQIIAEGLRPDAGGADGREHRRAVDDWSLPVAVANEHLVGPAFYASLSAAGTLDDLPLDVRDYLALLHQSNVARNAALRQQLVELLQALGRADIEGMVLKGARSFAVPLYPDPGMRLFRDLDVVVRADQIARAQAVLAELGYAVATTYTPDLNAVAEYTRAGDPGAVDLHVEIVDARHLLPAAELWKRAVPASVGPVPCVTPSATDAVLHHLLHAQIHFRGAFYFGALELRQLYEFVALMRCGGAEIDWPYVLAQLDRHGLRTVLESYARAAERWLGAPWPLPTPPSRAARFHEWRTSLQLSWPTVEAWTAPWANLRAAFVGHRMNARYPELRGVTRQRAWHLVQYLRKATPRAFARRLFRDRY